MEPRPVAPLDAAAVAAHAHAMARERANYFAGTTRAATTDAQYT